MADLGTNTGTTGTGDGTAQQQNQNQTQGTVSQVQQQTTQTNTEGKVTEGDKKYSDADVNEILNQKFKKWQEQKDAEINEAKKLAEMNEAQKAKYENEKLQKQLNELMQKNTLSEMTKTARNILAEDGITVSDDLLSVLVSPDAEKTNAAVESFKKLFKDTIDKAVKEALKGNPPKAGASKPGSMTKEQIMNIKDAVERQKMMMQHKELFGL